jgi:hypothetical protein
MEKRKMFTLPEIEPRSSSPQPVAISKFKMYSAVTEMSYIKDFRYLPWRQNGGKPRIPIPFQLIIQKIKIEKSGYINQILMPTIKII